MREIHMKSATAQGFDKIRCAQLLRSLHVFVSSFDPDAIQVTNGGQSNLAREVGAFPSDFVALDAATQFKSLFGFQVD